MISIDCDRSADCELGIEPCEACKLEDLEQSIDALRMAREELDNYVATL